MFKKSMRVLCAVLMLSACSPSYNWREVEVVDGRVRAAFPARVQTETRAMSLGGRALQFSLTSAQVHEAVFAVGHAPLPPAVVGDPAARAALGKTLKQSLYANLGVSVPQTLPDDGDEITVHGRTGERAGWLLARVWVTDTLLVEAVAVGTEQALPVEQAQEFVRSVTVRQ